jgi:heme iron utilization protein
MTTRDDGREAAERAAQARVEAQGGAQGARALLHAGRYAVLATQSQRRPGWPSASLVPYALGAGGEPLLLFSDLAQHTRNVEADPHVCLFVFDGEAAGADPRTAPRLAVYGRAARVPGEDEGDARDRYVARHPAARGLLQLDFHVWRVEVDEAQWVGGFAAAGWIAAAELLEAE